jgi:TonB family protein
MVRFALAAAILAAGALASPGARAAGQAAHGPNADQQGTTLICGHVAYVSCNSPTSGIEFRLATPSGDLKSIAIPWAIRQRLGSRIEERYEQRWVCIRLDKAAARREPLAVDSLDQLQVVDPQSPVPLSETVARTCDPDATQRPKLLRQVPPNYPHEAFEAKLNGSVFLRGVVHPDGTVGDILVVHSLAGSLDRAAEEAFAQWSFQPATRRGEPVAMAIIVQMAFAAR